MATNKKSVLLYCDIIHTVEELTDEEAGKLFKHYLRYINDQNPTAPDKLTQIVFEPIKQNLKRDLIKWKERSERNSLIARDGWEKRKNANAYERIKTNAKNADKDTVTDKDIVKDIKLTIPFSSDEFLEVWGLLLKEPKWKKKSTNALKLSLKKIESMNELDAIQCIKNTIAGGWQGLFPDSVKTPKNESSELTPQERTLIAFNQAKENMGL